MIQLTDAAAARICALTQSDPTKALRIRVRGGGCAGLQYHMDLDVATSHDKQFSHNGATILVDNKSFLFLNNMTLDWKEDVLSSQFIFVNPNVSRSCGCGHSFSV